MFPGARALRTIYRLPAHKQRLHNLSVTIIKDVAYGSRKRTVMDIYVPAQELAKGQIDTSKPSEGVQGKANGMVDPHANVPTMQPVALFCHGGVWATGTLHLQLQSIFRQQHSQSCMHAISCRQNVPGPTISNHLPFALTVMTCTRRLLVGHVTKLTFWEVK